MQNSYNTNIFPYLYVKRIMVFRSRPW